MVTAWIAALVFAASGVALIVRRDAAARGQGLVFGGRMPAGCAVAEGVGLLVLALVVVLFGSRLF